MQGLLLDGERKSIEPMASRLAGADVQALRQFVGQSPWAVEAVQRCLAHKVVDLLSEAEVWIIDETSFPKAGRHSVGAATLFGKPGVVDDPGHGWPQLCGHALGQAAAHRLPRPRTLPPELLQGLHLGTGHAPGQRFD